MKIIKFKKKLESESASFIINLLAMLIIWFGFMVVTGHFIFLYAGDSGLAK